MESFLWVWFTDRMHAAMKITENQSLPSGPWLFLIFHRVQRQQQPRASSLYPELLTQSCFLTPRDKHCLYCRAFLFSALFLIFLVIFLSKLSCLSMQAKSQYVAKSGLLQRQKSECLQARSCFKFSIKKISLCNFIFIKRLTQQNFSLKI